MRLWQRLATGSRKHGCLASKKHWTVLISLINDRVIIFNSLTNIYYMISMYQAPFKEFYIEVFSHLIFPTAL